MLIVVIPNAWGRAETLLQAANIARRQLGKSRGKKLPPQYIAYEYDPAKTPKAYIDDMGALCWEGEKPKEVAKVGLGE